MKKKLILFGALNVLQGLLIGGLPFVVSSRVEAVNWTLGLLGGGMLLAGPILVFAGKWGRRFAAAMCLIHWLAGLTAIVLVVMSASYLQGIYGQQGQSAAAIAFVLAAVVAVAFWLIPLHEIHFLRDWRDPR